MSEDHPFAALAATWRGGGRGEYPTIDPFSYVEELVIAPIIGRPVAQWRSSTRDATTGEPRHGESGYLRATARGIELVVAHSFGIVETATGSYGDGVLVLTSGGLLGTPSAKRIDEVARRYEVGADAISYDIAMAAVGEPLTHHLTGELQRG